MNMDDNNYVDFEEAQPEKKDNKKTIIIVVAAVAVVVCCCCIALFVGYNYLGDPIAEALGII